MSTTLTPLPVEKNVTPVRLDPAWNRARELLEMGRACASELAAEIGRLRQAHNAGHGGDRGANQHGKFTSVNLPQGQGFVAQLSSQLGLHPQQAKRIEEAADYQLRIERVADAAEGAEIEVPDKGGNTRIVLLTAEHIAQAKQAVAGMALPGAPRPSRAWAGIMGEGARVGVKGAGKRDRAPVNHAENIARGLTALQTSLPHWGKLSPTERFAIEQAWAKLVLPLVPATFAGLAK